MNVGYARPGGTFGGWNDRGNEAGWHPSGMRCSWRGIRWCRSFLAQHRLMDGMPPASGIRYLASGIWHPVFGIRGLRYSASYLAFGIWPSVFGLRYSAFVFGLRYLAFVFGLRYLAFGIGLRYSAFGIRPSVFGLRYSAFGIRPSVFGLRYSVFVFVFGLRLAAFPMDYRVVPCGGGLPVVVMRSTLQRNRFPAYGMPRHREPLAVVEDKATTPPDHPVRIEAIPADRSRRVGSFVGLPARCPRVFSGGRAAIFLAPWPIPSYLPTSCLPSSSPSLPIPTKSGI